MSGDPIGYVARHKASGLICRDFTLPDQRHDLANGYEWVPVALWRPDTPAIDAAPGLKGKHAVVAYFKTEADMDEFVAAITEVHPGMRTVKLP